MAAGALSLNSKYLAVTEGERGEEYKNKAGFTLAVAVAHSRGSGVSMSTDCLNLHQIKSKRRTGPFPACGRPGSV